MYAVFSEQQRTAISVTGPPFTRLRFHVLEESKLDDSSPPDIIDECNIGLISIEILAQRAGFQGVINGAERLLIQWEFFNSSIGLWHKRLAIQPASD